MKLYQVINGPSFKTKKELLKWIQLEDRHYPIKWRTVYK